MTANIGTALIEVEVNRRALESDIDKAGKAAGQKLGKSTSSSFKSALVGIGIGALVKDAFAEAEDAQRTAARTDSVLKSTGEAAGVTAGHVADLGTELGDLAAVDNDVVQAGENVLLTFTKVRNVGKDDIFDQATASALDMSAALGTDLQGAIIQVGKALNDPIKGVTALRRVGVSFTEAQQDQIKALVESGRLLDAQKLILKELQTEFGGAAESMVTDGQRARVAFADLEESIGGALAPAMSTLASVTSHVADVFGALPGPLQTAILLGGAGAVAWGKWGNGLSQAASAAVKLGSQLIVPDQAIQSIGKDSVSAGAGLTKMQSGFLAAGIAAASVVAAYQAVRNEIDKSNQRTADALDRVKNQGDLGTDAGQKAQLENLQKQYDLTYKITKAEADKAIPNAIVIDEGMEILDGLRQQYHTLQGQQGEVDRLSKRYGLTRDEVIKYGSEAAIVAANVKRATERDALPSLEEVRQKWADVRTEAQGAKSDFVHAFDVGMDPQQAAIDTVRAQQDVQKSLKENGNSFDIQTEKGRANREAYLQARDTILDYAQSLIDTGTPLAEVKRLTELQIKALGEQAEAGGATKDQVKALNDEMNLTPERVDVAFATPGLDTAIKKIQDLNAALLFGLVLQQQQEAAAHADRNLRTNYGITNNGGDLTPHGRSGTHVHGNVYVDAKDKPASEVGNAIDRAAVRRMVR